MTVRHILRYLTAVVLINSSLISVGFGEPCPPILCDSSPEECADQAAALQCGVSDAPTLQGYGVSSSFGDGAGATRCVVTSLADSGPGSLRECIAVRSGPVDNPIPRRVVFDVGGTITLLSDLPIRQPYLTIDGFSAPQPGITIEKQGDGTVGQTRIQTWKNNLTCGHDILVTGLRFKGTWTRDTEQHSQNADLLSVDGEDLPGCIHDVVIWRNTYIDGQDAVGQFWGSVTNSTFAYNLVAYSYHPQTVSHEPGGNAGQERQRLSIHHNVYANVHERIPNIRGNVWDANIEQNIFHKWSAFGFPGGYATSFRCRNGGCPRRVNMTDNIWSSAGSQLQNAIVYTDGADKNEVYDARNIVPPGEFDQGTSPVAFGRSDEVDILPIEAIPTQMLPFVGHPFPTSEEQILLNEVLGQAIQDSGQR